MGFEIRNRKGTQIAVFLFEQDRDKCLDLLNEDGYPTEAIEELIKLLSIKENKLKQ